MEKKKKKSSARHVMCFSVMFWTFQRPIIRSTETAPDSRPHFNTPGTGLQALQIELHLEQERIIYPMQTIRNGPSLSSSSHYHHQTSSQLECRCQSGSRTHGASVHEYHFAHPSKHRQVFEIVAIYAQACIAIEAVLNQRLGWVENVQESFSVHLLGGCEHNHLKTTRNLFQKMLKMGALSNIDIVQRPIKINRKVEIGLCNRLNGAVNKGFIKV